VDGVIVAYKQSGPTSHDVVAEIRRIFGQKRVGHTGTLDPMATGVLLVCLGKATRIAEYLVGLPKEYRARMVLGQETETQDSTGAVVCERDASGVTREALEQVVAGFVGEIEQVPPMISALKHQGRPLYKLAREGKVVDRSPRSVRIHSIDITCFQPSSEGAHLPQAEFVVRCSSGTYIRAICADIGDVLGCGAHMSMLERTSVGRFGIEASVTIDRLQELQMQEQLAEAMISISDALADMPEAVVEGEHADRIRHGQTVPVRSQYAGSETVRVLTSSGELVAIGALQQLGGTATVVPRKVIDTGEPGQ